MPNKPAIGENTTALALTGNANVNDENKRVGVSFGNLLSLTGQAVGQTQLSLNQTGADMASALATTKVDVIAVQTLHYNEFGNFTNAESHTRQLPLINFVDPVFYEWKEVRLRGQFIATEFVSSEESSSTVGSGSQTSNNYGLFMLIGPGSRGDNSTKKSTTSDTDTSRDTSWGRIRASALLAPKQDIGVPKPRHVVRGPSLTILAGETVPVQEGGKVVGRAMSATIELRNLEGKAIAEKGLSIDAQGVPWRYAVPGEVGKKTDTNGQIAIVLTRTYVTDDADKSPINVVVTARLGIVATNTTLTF